MPGTTPERHSRCLRYPGTANRVVIDFYRPGVGRTYDETTSDDQEPVTILLQVGGFLGMLLARFLLIWLDALCAGSLIAPLWDEVTMLAWPNGVKGPGFI